MGISINSDHFINISNETVTGLNYNVNFGLGLDLSLGDVYNYRLYRNVRCKEKRKAEEMRIVADNKVLRRQIMKRRRQGNKNGKSKIKTKTSSCEKYIR